jgi:uncharacterized protein (TIGR03437 family)
VITAVENASNATVGASNAPQPGDKLTLLVTGLSAAGTSVDASLVEVTVGGLGIPATMVSVDSNGVYRVEFTLDSAVSTGARIPVAVFTGGRTSLPVYIPIR